MRGIVFASAAGAAVFLLSLPAAANGRFPASNQLVFSPTDDNLLILRTSYGLLPSHDHGASWGYICEDALGLGPTAVEDPAIGLTEHNVLIAGVSVGLDVSTDLGCNWNCIGGPLAGQSLVDTAIRPDTPTSAVALTRSYQTTDAALETVYSQVFETTDEGTTWSPTGVPIDPTVVVATVDVTNTDPNRLYVSGVRGLGIQRTASLFVSMDKGATWTEEMLPPAQFDPTTEDSIYIGAVDPNNADRVYIRSSGLLTGGRSRLTLFTRSPDGGGQFTTEDAFDVDAQTGPTGELLGFALSPDGSKVYIGSKESGLWVASTTDFVFHQNSTMVVQCLATHGNELWACSSAASGFIAGVSTDDGVTFTSKLPLIGSLTGPISCAANPQGAACGTSANASQCVAAYATFCSSEVCGTDAGGTGTTTAAASKSSSCDVGLVGGGGATLFGAFGALTGLAWRRRRKTR